MNRRPLCLAIIAVLFLSGCSTPTQRIEQNRELFEAFTPEQRDAIKVGQLAPGFTPDMVRMAWGEPSETVTRTSENSVREIWSYSTLRSRDLGPHATFHPSAGRREETPRAHRQGRRGSQDDWARVVFEDGLVTDIQRVVGR